MSDSPADQHVRAILRQLPTAPGVYLMKDAGGRVLYVGKADSLRNRVRRQSVSTEEETVTVTVSIGVALFRTHGHDMLELLASADLALYRAKQTGRDRICLPALQKS